jgi:hypothetical protein
MLYENHYVRLYDERNPKDSNERNQNKTTDGEWSFDEALKQYAISLNGATTIRGILVHAISEEAKAFYLALGFDPSPIDPMTLMITLSDVRKSIESIG